MVKLPVNRSKVQKDLGTSYFYELQVYGGVDQL